MAKNTTEQKFRDMLDETNARIEELKSKHDETKYFEHIIWDGFLASYMIAIKREFYPEFGRDLATVLCHQRVCSSIMNVNEFWNRWPRRTTTFGMYQFLGVSALHVAARFMQTIEGVALIARVYEFKSSESDGFTTVELERWANAMQPHLEQSLCLSLWPKGLMRRDCEVLTRQIDQDIKSLDKQPKPSPWVETITIAGILKIIANKQSEIASHHKTVSDWSKNWKSLDPPRTRNRRFYWSEVRVWILENKQFDIGPFQNLQK